SEDGTEAQSADLPALLVACLAFLRGNFQRQCFGDQEWMPVHGRLHGRADLVHAVPDPALELQAQWTVARRHAVIRRSLKYGEMGGGLGNNRCGLDAGGASTELPYALAGEIHAFVRPVPGVVPLSLELVEAGYIRHVCRRQATDGGYQELCDEDFSGLRRYPPAISRFVVVR